MRSKSAIFWSVVASSLVEITDVSEERVFFIFRVEE
jgi:hypothetical protein